MRYSLLLLMLLLAGGRTRTMTKAGLDAKAAEHNGFTFPDETYYVGSDDQYDYFVIRRGLGRSTSHYRVLQTEAAETNRFNLTKDEKHWRGYGITGVRFVNGKMVSSTYVVKIVNGQVFLSLNAKPDQMIGPFIKRSDTEYTFETDGQGKHSLSMSASGEWLYSWDYIQMRAEPVDGRALVK